MQGTSREKKESSFYRSEEFKEGRHKEHQDSSAGPDSGAFVSLKPLLSLSGVSDRGVRLWRALAPAALCTLLGEPEELVWSENWVEGQRFACAMVVCPSI